MSPSSMLKPDDRGPADTDILVWHSSTGAEFRFHLRVRYLWVKARVSERGAPVEIWLKPSRKAGREGSDMSSRADETGIALSLLLRHGHSLADLRERFKPGSLYHAAIAFAWRIAVDAGADVPGLPDELVVAGATEVKA